MRHRKPSVVDFLSKILKHAHASQGKFVSTNQNYAISREFLWPLLGRCFHGESNGNTMKLQLSTHANFKLKFLGFFW